MNLIALRSSVCAASWVMLRAVSGAEAGAAGEVVSGSGCVERGVEATCVILMGTKSHKVFNLYFKDKPPMVDTAISFSGTTTSNPNFCMQGSPVSVTTWTQLKMKCPNKAEMKMANVMVAESEKKYCGQWSAWYNAMPVGPKSIHVAGMCEFPTTGYTAVLTKAPAGAGQSGRFAVVLSIKKPTGPAGQMITHQAVHYSEPSETQFKEAEISPDNVVVPVRVVQ